MRVFAGGISTETNTFSPIPTGLADFDIVRAADIAAGVELESASNALATFQKMAQARGWEFIFSLFADAQPAGLTVRSVYEGLRDEMLAALQDALPVDIVLLSLHGAMVAQGYDDCETDILQHVRAIVGQEVKIGVELDLHCDVSEEMIRLADAIVIFKEYPHTDIADRAAELFELAADAAEGKTRPVMGLFDCRMIGMYLTPFEPMRSFVDAMRAQEGKEGVLSLSLAHCFPWADVPTTGTRMLAITDGDARRAQQVAEEWGRRFFALRHDVRINTLPMDVALDQALRHPTGPVVVADQADNPGGGAPSDSTFVLKALLERGVRNAAIGMFWDPTVVHLARAAGVGAQINVRLGGKLGPASGDPLDLTVTVTAIEPEMTQNWPQDNGKPLPIPVGDAVALHCNGIDIIANSKRCQVFSPDVFSQLGVQPEARHLLVVKSTQHFYAGFHPIASTVIYMSAPGAIAPLFRDIPYTRVDLRKYPWIDDPFADA